jgi:anti-sigma regulatory factor (Ser/Thr protein kinase)
VSVFPREEDSVGAARHWVATALEEAHVATKVCADAVLIVSELVTNALRHGLGDVVVRCGLRDDGGVDVAVTDSGDELPTVMDRDPNRVGGVGLHIVDRLSRTWGVASFPGGKTVWATIGGS